MIDWNRTLTGEEAEVFRARSDEIIRRMIEVTLVLCLMMYASVGFMQFILWLFPHHRHAA